MTYDRHTSILGSTDISATTAKAYARSHGARGNYSDYIDFIWRWAPELGLSPLVVFGQWCDETATGTSARWLKGDPAGIGVFADDTPSTLTPNITGAQSAAIHLAELASKVDKALHVGVGGIDIRQIDPHIWRVQTFIANRAWPDVAELHDLRRPLSFSPGDYVWAANQAYGDQIANHMNRIQAYADANPVVHESGDTTPGPSKGNDTVHDLNMTKGLIPLPPFVEAYVDVSRRDTSASCRGYDMLGNRATPPKGLVLHRPQSNPMTSNEGYLDSRCCPALFDYEVLADGSAKRFAHLGDFASGWANGVVSAPYGDALKWLEFVGWDINTVNRDWESCEVGGWLLQPGATSHEDPITDEQWAWVAQLAASRAHDYGITYLDFPIIKAENDRSYLTWHQEWTIGTGKICPGATLINGTSALVERARAIMKAAQLGSVKPEPKPPVYAPSVLPDWFWKTVAQSRPSDAKDGDLMYRTVRRNVEALKRTQRYSQPDTKAKISGPPIEVRTKVYIERIVDVPYVDSKGRAKQRQWGVTDDGHWVLMSGFNPRITVRGR